ncbi:hypothetical protein CAEBREN_06809 [Caenorhabditis brenneri]|uniref:RBR-type E3 ubiquitin transferase n=1 Tax=Caenorhabditis brenneri TaxID=135651 RepID=G0MUT4_CAEBE|nr:hypothetical protein CAEBREN_06809 [Caenorhabditis brenneri]
MNGQQRFRGAQARQFQYNPNWRRSVQIVSTRLRMVVEYSSTLRDVRLEKKVKQTFDPFPRDRNHLQEVQLISSSSRGRQDLEKLKRIQNRLKERIGRMGADWWMETAVMYPLGPEQIQKIEKEGINLQGLSYKLLINHTDATALLAVKRCQTEELTTKIIETAFSQIIEHQPVLLSEPNSGYAIQMCGEEPKIIEDPRDTKYALVFDEMFLERGATDATIFYGYETGCKIVSTRAINEPESRLIEKRLGKDMGSRPLRLLKFETPNSRNCAERFGKVEFVDIFYCDTQFGYCTPQESVALFLKFDLGQARRDGIEITLPRSNEFAVKAFRLHYLEAVRINVYGETCRRMEGNWKKLIIDDFPRDYPTTESRLWLINRIIQANNIRVESIKPYTKLVDDCFDRRNSDVIKVIAEKLRWHSSDEDDASWKVVRHNRGPNEEVEYVDIHFDQLRSGMNIVNSILISPYSFLFELFNGDSRRAELIPCYRRTIAVSRVIRVALDHTIRQFDYDLRTHFTKLTASGDPIMEQRDAAYYRLRIHEEWNDGSDAGIIGIEGWSPDAVREQFQNLEGILKPKAFGGCLHLLSGPGAVFAKSLEGKYRDALLVELDKHSEEVKLIGDAAEDAWRELQGYSSQNTSIRCTIPAYFPILNHGIRYFLTSDVMEGIRSALGLQYLVHNWEKSVIEFEGTVAGYEKLMEVLEGVSQEILMKETEGNGGSGVCPTCLVPIDSTMDFYRFQCGHVMCRQCANNMISTMDAGKVKCADGECQKFVSPFDVFNIIFGSGSIRDYRTSRLNTLILKCKAAILTSSEGKISECTTTDCPGLRIKANGDPLLYKSCTSCHQNYCRNCLAGPHRGHSCERWAELQGEEPAMEEFLNTIGKNKVKKCPMCSGLVEKTEGCSHMECKCGCHFCWRCLYYVTKVVGPDPVYQHMKEEHGEDPIVDPEELAAEDFAIQGLLLNQAGPRHHHHRPAVWHRQMDDSSDDDSDDDSDDNSDDGWGIRAEDVE